MITVTWLPMRQDVRDAARAARRSLPFARRHAPRLVGAVLTAVVVVLLLLGIPAAGALGGGLVPLLFGSSLTDARAWHYSVYLRHSVAATVDRDGLRYTGNGMLTFDDGWPWSAFRYAVETDEQFVFVGLRNKSGFAPYLPKRAVADPQAVRDMIPLEFR